MQRNLKKMWPAIATSMLLTSITYADSNDSSLRNIENRIHCLEENRNVKQMINPPAMPLTRNGWDFQISADALLWQLQEDALAYAVNDSSLIFSGPNFSGASDFITDVGSLKQKYHWGFRIGLDWTTAFDNWDLAATWTHLISNSDQSSFFQLAETPILPEIASTPELIPTQGIQDLSVASQEASAKYHNRLDQISLNIGREFFVSKWVTMRPYFGLRSNWINQRLRASYSGRSFEDQPILTVNTKPTNKWWGIGIESGLNTQLEFCAGFSLYGNIAYAIEYGLQKLQVSQSSSSFPEGSLNSSKTSYHMCRPMLDLQIGLGWDHNFCNDRYHWGLKLGWENHVFFNQSHFLFLSQVNIFQAYSDVQHKGDLTYQGWTLHASFDF